MLSWLRKYFGRQMDTPPKGPARTSSVRVDHDDKRIIVFRPGAREEAIAWGDLGSVIVQTTDKGPFEIDLHWVLSDRHGHRGPVVPMGAQGEQELLKTMQSRLHGFDNMAVVEAMGSTEAASFVVWERK
jgi:hypothetical protein